MEGRDLLSIWSFYMQRKFGAYWNFESLPEIFICKENLVRVRFKEYKLHFNELVEKFPGIQNKKMSTELHDISHFLSAKFHFSGQQNLSCFPKMAKIFAQEKRQIDKLALFIRFNIKEEQDKKIRFF
jgi:hypothetical protein